MPEGSSGENSTLEALVGTTWQAEEIEGRPATGSVGRDRPTLVILGGNRVAGSGGCNQFQGEVQGNGASVRFGPFATTRMACRATVMDQERRYLMALGKGGRLEREADTLLLKNDADTASVRFSRFVPLVPKANR